MERESLGREIVDAAVMVHREMGPGLLEKVYKRCLASELQQRGLEVCREVSIGLWWRDEFIKDAFRVDLVVGGMVIVECKATTVHHEVYARQVLSYLRAMDLHLGFLLNFGGMYMRDGIRRVVHTPRQAGPAAESMSGQVGSTRRNQDHDGSKRQGTKEAEAGKPRWRREA